MARGAGPPSEVLSVVRLYSRSAAAGSAGAKGAVCQAKSAMVRRSKATEALSVWVQVASVLKAKAPLPRDRRKSRGAAVAADV